MIGWCTLLRSSYSESGPKTSSASDCPYIALNASIIVSAFGTCLLDFL